MVILEQTENVRWIKQGIFLIVVVKDKTETWNQVYISSEMSNNYAYTEAKEIYYNETRKEDLRKAASILSRA